MWSSSKMVPKPPRHQTPQRKQRQAMWRKRKVKRRNHQKRNVQVTVKGRKYPTPPHSSSSQRMTSWESELRGKEGFLLYSLIYLFVIYTYLSRFIYLFYLFYYLFLLYSLIYLFVIYTYLSRFIYLFYLFYYFFFLGITATRSLSVDNGTLLFAS